MTDALDISFQIQTVIMIINVSANNYIGLGSFA